MHSRDVNRTHHWRIGLYSAWSDLQFGFRFGSVEYWIWVQMSQCLGSGSFGSVTLNTGEQQMM